VFTDHGDDNVALKANSDGPTENVTVTDCTFLHGHGVSVGSETAGGVRNILVQRCTFENTGTAIRIKSARDRGGVIEDVTYRDVTMKNVDAAIYINLFYEDKSLAKFPRPKPVTAETPVVRNNLISKVTCVNAKSAGEITALPESFATNVTLENVRISAWSGFSIQDAQGLEFKNVSIAAEAGVTTYLGRPWRPYASVAFLNTQMPEAIYPEGWQNWNNAANNATARYAEWKNSGPGAKTDARVPWAKQLTAGQARAITLNQVLGDWNPGGASMASGQ